MCACVLGLLNESQALGQFQFQIVIFFSSVSLLHSLSFLSFLISFGLLSLVDESELEERETGRERYTNGRVCRSS